MNNNITFAGLKGWKYILSNNNPDNLEIIITPKGTSKSYTLTQRTLFNIENQIWKYGILNIKTTFSSHKTTSFPLYLDLIKKYQLKNYKIENTNNEKSFIKSGFKSYFYGAKEQETRLTGWSLPIDSAWYDEYLNSKDNKSIEYQKSKASATRKIISSVGREILKVNQNGKMTFSMNLHYKDQLFSPLIYDNFDIKLIRSEVKKNGFYYARLVGNPLWKKGISFLFLDPEINEFLPDEIKEMDYGSTYDNQAMKESIPDDSTNPEFIHKRYIDKSIKFTSFEKNAYIEPLFCSIDPASGKDEYVISFGGFDFKRNKLIIIGGFNIPTIDLKGMKNISEAINDLHEEALFSFFELSTQKGTKNYLADFSKMWIFSIDSNQKSSSYDFIKKLWNRDKTLEDKCFFSQKNSFGQYKNDFRETITVASKNGDYTPTLLASDLNDLFSRNKIEFFKNDFNLSLLNQIYDVRTKINPNSQERMIISNGNDDKYDTLRYMIEAIKKRKPLWNLLI